MLSEQRRYEHLLLELAEAHRELDRRANIISTLADHLATCRKRLAPHDTGSAQDQNVRGPKAP